MTGRASLKRRAIKAAFTVALTFAGTPALAPFFAPANAADIEFGRYLATECMTCHGMSKADSTIPDIFGLGEAHFVEVIRAYRAKALPNPIMQTVSERLKDDEIAALAAFFATAKP
jgi:cytochrome c